MNEPQSVQTDSKKDAQDNKLFAIVAYIPILFLIPLLAAKESPFARYHANQGALVTIIWAAGYLITSIVPGLLNILLGPIFGLLMLAIFIIGVLNVSKGEMKPLPIIGETKLIK
ncbi:hypothetical protein [Alkalicoccobacillus plakortidis]|uniref:Tic20 family protein n=1 Tax=Alkalicoccobacillus plakortidis TaxID=444060 RepID=A0ABT0XMC4_9BACI|nr:hypothetical protein [Alkalicoccobacillus plakortidis]MCM2677059.1 hypothetical protein [Alkalicoccobacillus plakortidis]